MKTWLLLVYKIPREPSANRVSIWRKLKRLGAISLHDALWVLPNKPNTREQLQWLVEEIEESGGEATLWESTPVSQKRHNALVWQFCEQADKLYAKILKEAAKGKPDLTALSRRYQQAEAISYFPSDLAKKVREALIAAAGESKR